MGNSTCHSFIKSAALLTRREKHATLELFTILLINLEHGRESDFWNASLDRILTLIAEGSWQNSWTLNSHYFELKLLFNVYNHNYKCPLHFSQCMAERSAILYEVLGYKYVEKAIINL